MIGKQANTDTAPPSDASSGYSIREAINLKSVSAGVVAALFGCSGPALIVISAAEAGQLSNGQTVAWLFAIYVLGGLISIGMRCATVSRSAALIRFLARRS